MGDGALRCSLNLSTKPTKPHISKEEWKAIKELRSDKERLVVTADKGVALVVMDKKDTSQK